MALNAERPLRADAARNRGRILDAAAGLFADRGLDVSIEDVASAAGVGVGTVYRRFADREELIEALFEEKAATIIEMARDALEIEDPWEAFASFFRAACHMQATDQGLREALLSADRGREHIARARAAIRPIAGELVARAQAAGELRPDVDVLDVPMLHFTVGRVADSCRAVAPAYFERVLTIMLDGLRVRPDGSTPMPAPPLAPDQFERALARRVTASRGSAGASAPS